jgi:solute carrier family 25 (mitochondrial phosphate transporter), member 23/24/25/41
VYEFAKRQMRAASWGIASNGGLHAGARLCAGGFAGMVAAIIVYPLEVIKTLRTVYPNEATGIISAGKAAMKYGGGIAGLYAGVLPTLVAMFPYVGVEFMVYETLKTRWAAYFGSVSTLALLLIGALAGAAAQAAAHPLDVVRRRMQMEGFRQRFGSGGGKKADGAPVKPPITNLVGGLYSIGKEEGIGCLFKGLGPACFEKVPSTAIGYYIVRRPRRPLDPPPDIALCHAVFVPAPLPPPCAPSSRAP